MSQPQLSPEERKRKRRPEEYAEAVAEYSKIAKEHHLHPGTHYRQLSRFLQGNSIYIGGHGNIQHNTPFRRHDLVVVHDLTDSGREIKCFDSITGLNELMGHPLPGRGCGQLLFVRGYPSRDWVNLIGSRYRVDPEIFRRHLDLDRSEDYFDTPSLPSATHNMIRLTTTSIGRHSVVGSKLPRQFSLDQYHCSLGRNPDAVGESLVRRFSAHSDDRFSIDQHISICVLKRGEGWVALILLDSGRDLDECPSGPWLPGGSKPRNFDNIFNPVIQFEPNICFRGSEHLDSADNTQGDQLALKRTYQQSSSLLHTKAYGSFLSVKIMKTDPFYALNCLFRFAANSESQFLNLLRAKLMDSGLHHQDEHMHKSLADLKRHKLILFEHIEHLHRVITIIKQRGYNRLTRSEIGSNAMAQSESSTRLCSAGSITDLPSLDLSKPPSRRPTLNALQNNDCETVAESLLEDYEDLVSRAQALCDLYVEGIRDIRDNAMLAESRKAIEQAEAVTHLTRLAYFFLPLSFTSTLFGMNFREIGNDLSIWIWVVTSIPVFLFAVLLGFWGQLSPIVVQRARHLRSKTSERT
ncbi:hypothetical protein GGR57DRAFT_516083 [Xylariaceae sp. FL1272]|nr:hypothetical protein GGR57DRAFT_516083 [Xylariaceae sp. FL1272]